MYYNWILVFHIFSVLSWLVGLLYLPRLFVYHKQNIDNNDFCSVVQKQERNLFKITTIAMVFTLITGSLLIIDNLDIMKTGGWIHAKFTFVLLLLVFHYSLYHYMKSLKDNSCSKSSKFFKIYNEIPSILLLLILIMVIVKPF